MEYKEYDVVRLMTNKYKKEGFYKGMVGTIMETSLHPRYMVAFPDFETHADDLFTLHEKHLQLVPEEQLRNAFYNAKHDVERYKNDTD
ncbi:hypothetical protein LJC20_05290 [Eubacteriales bacterium OttesenSCG-928-M02]|nr:hypothetical protein [Eubacteriales bacterium OttesenSCG-928-M02]